MFSHYFLQPLIMHVCEYYARLHRETQFFLWIEVRVLKKELFFN